MLKYTKSYAPRPYLKSQEYGIMEYVLLEILGKDLFELFVLCVMIVWTPLMVSSLRLCVD